MMRTSLHSAFTSSRLLKSQYNLSSCELIGCDCRTQTVYKHLLHLAVGCARECAAKAAAARATKSPGDRLNTMSATRKNELGLLQNFFLVCVILIIYIQLATYKVLASPTELLKGSESEYTIILPYIADKNGLFVSSDFQNIPRPETFESNSRTKRDTYTQGSQEHLNIAFSLKGETLQLSLAKTEDLIAPGAVMIDMAGNVTSATILNQECFYQGQVKQMPGSFVAISTCEGLLGLMKTDNNDEYLIEPLDTIDTYSDGQHTGRPHALKKIKTGQALRDSGSIKSNSTTEHRHRHHHQSRDHPSHHHHRSKRYSSKKHLEVLLVSDQSVVKFHSGDRKKTKTYLLTLMNIVSSAYRHHSLGVVINVVVVKILILDSYQANSILWRGDARRTLDRFCRWSQTQVQDTSSADNHDFAVYITRDNLGPAGYAPVTGMCRPDRSCAVTKDDGLTSAFVIAHETGHVLGMQHDGQGNSCDGNGESIMAPLVQSTYSRYFWSTCSAHELRTQISAYKCLEDSPFLKKWPALKEPLGVSWDMDEQCRQEFGNDYRLCYAFRHIDPCQHLWCATASNPMLCKTKKGPPLPGTKCREGHWCMDERCVVMSDDTVINGGWSTWSNWGYCTRTCGGGIRSRQRSCDNPKPRNGGRDCVGQSDQHEICNREACYKRVDVREKLCKQQNSWHNGKHHKWAPYQTSHESKLCKLTCVSKNTREIVTFNENVPDGTPCSYERFNDRCIDGKCNKFGCDGKFESNKLDDMCGVCEGQGTDCKMVSGSYREAPEDDYRTVVKLPKDSRNIEVKRAVYSAHFLAVKDPKTGEFILNGDKRRGSSKEFIAYGTRFVYTINAYQERLTGSGPLGQDVLVLVYPVKNKTPANIDYQYTVPKKEYSNVISTNIDDRYGWQFKEWTECTKICGGGTQHIHYECKDKYDNVIVNLDSCSSKTKPDEHRRKCNEFKCKNMGAVRWVIGSWEHCSTSCGNDGIQMRSVQCLSKNSKGKEKEVSPDYCPQPMPERERPCNRKLCPGKWKTSRWSKCSVTCGRGVQTRSVQCETKNDGNTYRCDSPAPPDTRECQKRVCAGCSRDRSQQYCRRKKITKHLKRFCLRVKRFKELCCLSCSKFENANRKSKY